MSFRKSMAALSVSLGLVGCVHTQEMPLAPNMVRLDTRASGIVFQGQAVPQTMRRAAELTLQNGYSHFRLEQANLSQGSQYSGTYTSGSATVYGGNGYAVANGSAISTPLYRPTSSVGVTVIMFHDNEPGAKGAFNASQVLKQYSQ